MASCTVAIGSSGYGTMRTPRASVWCRTGRAVTAGASRPGRPRCFGQVFAIGQAELPLVELRVHQLGLGVALAFIADEELLDDGHDGLARLLRDPEVGARRRR